METTAAATPVEPIGQSIACLPLLDRLEENLFANRFSETDRGTHLFGGQVMAQALAAASATVDARTCHSLHGYFIAAGNSHNRVLFEVERTRDGGRFTTRRVVAKQADRVILDMHSSFHAGEHGYRHQAPMPHDVPAPEDLAEAPSLADWVEPEEPRAANLLRMFRLIDIRVVDHRHFIDPRNQARRRLWLRIPSAAYCEDAAIHQQLLTYLSDYWLVWTPLIPHPLKTPGPGLSTASLDHALWIHRPHRVDEWLLYDCDSPWAGDGRGLSRGMLYDREGNLVASTAQEGLLRVL